MHHLGGNLVVTAIGDHWRSNVEWFQATTQHPPSESFRNEVGCLSLAVCSRCGVADNFAHLHALPPEPDWVRKECILHWFLAAFCTIHAPCDKWFWALQSFSEGNSTQWKLAGSLGLSLQLGAWAWEVLFWVKSCCKHQTLWALCKLLVVLQGVRSFLADIIRVAAWSCAIF